MDVTCVVSSSCGSRNGGRMLFVDQRRAPCLRRYNALKRDNTPLQTGGFLGERS